MSAEETLDVCLLSPVVWAYPACAGLGVPDTLRELKTEGAKLAAGVAWITPRVGDVFEGWTVRELIGQIEGAAVSVVESVGGELRLMILGLASQAGEIPPRLVMGLAAVIQSSAPIIRSLTKEARIAVGEVSSTMSEELRKFSSEALETVLPAIISTSIVGVLVLGVLAWWFLR